VRTLALLAVLAAVPALSEPKPAPPPAVTKVAVFGIGLDTVAGEAAGRVEGRVQGALTSKGIDVVDYDNLFPPPEPASLEDGEKLFKQAREAYDNLDADLACEHLANAIKFFKKHPVETKPSRLAEVSIFFGAALLQKGDANGAKEAFVQAIELDGEAKPLSDLFGKDVVNAFTAAQLVLGDRPKGSLAVDSVPGGARAVVAGVDLGLTPVTSKELPVGRHHVIITRPGYVPFGALPDIGAGRPTELSPTLEANPGFAEVLKAAAKLWANPAFHEGPLPAEATKLGGRLHARQLVFITVTTGNDGKPKASIEAVDLVRGDRLKDVTFDVDDGWRNTTAAADKIEKWLARPSVVEPVRKPFVLPPVLKEWWLWAAVGGAAAVVTTTVVVANQPPRGLNLVLGTP
jgi:hypothetical protein